MNKTTFGKTLCAVLIAGLVAGVPGMVHAEQAVADNYTPPTAHDYEWLVKPSLDYREIQGFKDGLALVVSEPSKSKFKFGFIDSKGNIAVPVIYSNTKGFAEGIGAVQNSAEKWGFVDKTGKTLIPFVYDDVELFHNSMAWVQKGGKWGFIDPQGKTILPFKYRWKTDLTDTMIKLRAFDSGDEMLYDMKKRSILLTMDTIGDYSDGLIKVQKGSKYGFADLTGKIVLPIVYDMIESFHEGLAVVGKMDNKDGFWKFGYINKKGKMVIPFTYRKASSFSEGIATVGTTYNNKTEQWTLRLIDKNGKDLLGKSLFHDVIDVFVDGIAVVTNWDAKTASSKFGLINNKGQIVLPIEYDGIDMFDDYHRKIRYPAGTIFTIKDEKYGYTDKNGKVTLEPTYSYITFLTEKIADVTGNGNYPRLMDMETGEIIKDSIHAHGIGTDHKKFQTPGGMLIRVYKFEDITLYNELGQQVMPVPGGDPSIKVLAAGEGYITAKQNGKWGIIQYPFVVPTRSQ